MQVFVALAVGLMLGSFLSVLLARWLASPQGGPHWSGVIMGRSRCTSCAHILTWHDLIPLVSWIIVRGECRYCNARISVRYPILELSMAIALGVYVYLFGVSSVWSIVDLAIVFGLVSLFFFDLRHMVLPDAIVIPLGVIAAIRLFHQRPEFAVNAFSSAVALAALFGFTFIFSGGRLLGFGDVKLAFVIGLLFGYPDAWLVTLFAVWAGAIVGILMIVMRRATMKTALPMGSFWAASALCMFFLQ